MLVTCGLCNKIVSWVVLQRIGDLTFYFYFWFFTPWLFAWLSRTASCSGVLGFSSNVSDLSSAGLAVIYLHIGLWIRSVISSVYMCTLCLYEFHTLCNLVGLAVKYSTLIVSRKFLYCCCIVCAKVAPLPGMCKGCPITCPYPELKCLYINWLLLSWVSYSHFQLCYHVPCLVVSFAFSYAQLIEILHHLILLTRLFSVSTNIMVLL
jgi:hypothetical protein